MTARLLTIVTAALALAAPVAVMQAQQLNPQESQAGAQQAYQQGASQSQNDATTMDADQWQLRNDGFEYRTYPLRPVDWPEGRPADPRFCGLTPQQAQRYQCQTISNEGRPYYYYEGQHGNIYARRPAVKIYSGSQDSY